LVLCSLIDFQMSELIDLSIKAAVLTAINKPLEIKNLTLQKLLPGQVLIKILYSGICRSQLMEVEGKRGQDNWLPHLLGHEASGIVMEIGPEVTKVKQGDEVILSWIKSSGIEAPGAIYHDNELVINSGAVTTFSNYSVVSENRLVKKPKDIPFHTAILLGCALPTGAGMIQNQLNISTDSSVAVIGLGGIGLSAILMLIAKKVKNIIAIDISEEKLAQVRSWGVLEAMNSSQVNIKERIHSLGFKNGVDFCIESAGAVQTIEQGFSLIRNNGGELLFASHPPDGEKISLAPHELISGKKISGSWGGGTEPDSDFPVLSRILMASPVSLDSLLSKEYSLNDINIAISDLSEGKVFRPLIKMEH
jgi:S-(hydroxymethyl)glutathione dehydrogenase/alcohol dehydrogenase